MSRAPRVGLSCAAGWALSCGSITLPRPYAPASLEPGSEPRRGPRDGVGGPVIPATGCRTVVCLCIAHDPCARQHHVDTVGEKCRRVVVSLPPPWGSRLAIQDGPGGLRARQDKLCWSGGDPPVTPGEHPCTESRPGCSCPGAA